jgi:hypothetical protein
MSQSDYIKYKRVAVELKEQAKLNPVIDAGQYTGFKEFALENTILHTKLRYQKISQTSTVNVFGIELSSSRNCPTFALCRGTNSRVNRKPLSAVRSAAVPLKPPPSHGLVNDLSICDKRLLPKCIS